MSLCEWSTSWRDTCERHAIASVVWALRSPVTSLEGPKRTTRVCEAHFDLLGRQETERRVKVFDVDIPERKKPQS